VLDGETVYLVPWRCPEPFAERLDLLLRNAALRESLGRAARTWAEQFRWSAVAERLDATYQSLLASAAAGTTCEVSHGRGRNRPRHTRCEVA
jgi:glycosyltransferase involved in cell wall biosynthesis